MNVVGLAKVVERKMQQARIVIPPRQTLSRLVANPSPMDAIERGVNVQACKIAQFAPKTSTPGQLDALAGSTCNNKPSSHVQEIRLYGYCMGEYGCRRQTRTDQTIAHTIPIRSAFVSRQCPRARSEYAPKETPRSPTLSVPRLNAVHTTYPH